jgi:hypothetical protein
MPMKTKTRERMPLSGEDIIMQYFRCIDNKDVDGAVELFDYDAVVHEPFSNVAGGLKGRSAIEPFIKVVMMANSNFKRDIEIQKTSNDENRITALVTFERGDRTKGRFTFEFTPDNNTHLEKKIKTLNIEF